jgi:hypothetical protein
MGILAGLMVSTPVVSALIPLAVFGRQLAGIDLLSCSQQTSRRDRQRIE